MTLQQPHSRQPLRLRPTAHFSDFPVGKPVLCSPGQSLRTRALPPSYGTTFLGQALLCSAHQWVPGAEGPPGFRPASVSVSADGDADNPALPPCGCREHHFGGDWESPLPHWRGFLMTQEAGFEAPRVLCGREGPCGCGDPDQRPGQSLHCSPPSPFDAKNPFLAVVTTNRKLNQGTERHLMHLELDISDSKIRYQLPPRPSPKLSPRPPVPAQSCPPPSP